MPLLPRAPSDAGLAGAIRALYLRSHPFGFANPAIAVRVDAARKIEQARAAEEHGLVTVVGERRLLTAL